MIEHEAGSRPPMRHERERKEIRRCTRLNHVEAAFVVPATQMPEARKSGCVLANIPRCATSARSKLEAVIRMPSSSTDFSLSRVMPVGQNTSTDHPAAASERAWGHTRGSAGTDAFST